MKVGRVIAAVVLLAGAAVGAAVARSAGLFDSRSLGAVATQQRAVEQEAAVRRAEHLAFTEIYHGHETRSLRATPNENFVSLLLRAGATQLEASDVLASMGSEYHPRRLEPGQQVNLFFERRGPGQARLIGLAFRSAPGASITVNRTVSGVFAVREMRIPLTFEIARIEAMVGPSLHASALERGATDREVAALADACGFDLDFQRDIRPTDRFEIVFERLYDEDGNTVRTGKILFVAISTRLGARRFFAFQAPGETSPAWYDSQGSSARRLLMKTPINGARVSSGFGMRTHPILAYSSSHRGVDFAAPTGTPIVAAGDGFISQAGWRGEYGNYIRLRHGDAYETAYAHLSGFGPAVRAGLPVRQGQIIGYVGSTGRSTGPHLHYEVLFRGTQIDPMSLHVATARNLSNRDSELFRAEVERIDEMRANLWRGLTRVPVTNLVGVNSDDRVAGNSGSIQPD